MEHIITYIIGAISIYLALGILFSVVFFSRYASHIDPNMKGSSLWTKLILLPGMTVLWLSFLMKVIKHKK